MATYHLSVKFGGKGKALAHASYITRDDKFSDRKDLEHAEHGNMPEWAKDEPTHFWQAADEFERANGSTYREFEIALPRELNPEQRLELVRDFVKQEIGDKHPYSFAIHNPQASIDGGDQPHVHIMMNQRVNDGFARSPEQHFKRYNAKYPERGGAKKDSPSITPTQAKQDLKALRQRWETKHNEHLQRHGHNQKIDSRSLKDRGIIRYPEQHFGFESAGRLTPEQKESIKKERGLSAEAAIEKAQSIDYTDKPWIKAIGADVKQQQLVKSLTQDISQQHGRLMKVSITQNGNVSMEKVKSRGTSMGW